MKLENGVWKEKKEGDNLNSTYGVDERRNKKKKNGNQPSGFSSFSLGLFHEVVVGVSRSPGTCSYPHKYENVSLRI